MAESSIIGGGTGTINLNQFDDYHVFIYYTRDDNTEVCTYIANTNINNPKVPKTIYGITYTLSCSKTDENELQIISTKTDTGTGTTIVTPTTLSTTALAASGTITATRSNVAVTPPETATSIDLSYVSTPNTFLFRSTNWHFVKRTYKAGDIAYTETDLGTSFTINSSNAATYGHLTTPTSVQGDFKIFIEYDDPIADMLITNNYSVCGNYFADNDSTTGLPLKNSVLYGTRITAKAFKETTNALQDLNTDSSGIMTATNFIEAVGDYDVYIPGNYVKDFISGNPVVAHYTLPSIVLHCAYGYYINPTTITIRGQCFNTSAQKNNYTAAVLASNPTVYSINAANNSALSMPTFVSASYTADTAAQELNANITVKNSCSTSQYIHLVYTNESNGTIVHHVTSSKISSNATTTFSGIVVTDISETSTTIFIFAADSAAVSFNDLKCASKILALDYNYNYMFDLPSWKIEEDIDLGQTMFFEEYYNDYA